MLVTFHAAAGAIIGEHVDSPFWAFGWGFLSHFLLDYIPHGDRSHITQFAMGQRLKWLFATRAADGIFTLLLIIFFFQTKLFLHPVAVAWGIVGGVLPDYIVGIYEFSKWKPLKKFYYYHHLIHNAWERMGLTFWHANFWQAVLILGILKML